MEQERAKIFAHPFVGQVCQKVTARKGNFSAFRIKNLWRSGHRHPSIKRLYHQKEPLWVRPIPFPHVWYKNTKRPSRQRQYFQIQHTVRQRTKKKRNKRLMTAVRKQTTDKAEHIMSKRRKCNNERMKESDNKRKNTVFYVWIVSFLRESCNQLKVTPPHADLW